MLRWHSETMINSENNAQGHDVPPNVSPVALAAPLPSGFNLNGYEIERLLGQGGFGFTYLAKDSKLRHQVAIKEYLPVTLARREDRLRVGPLQPKLLERFELGKKGFLKEGQTLARFKHPNIVRVLTFFEANGTGYLVMDYEQGESLKDMLARLGHLEERELHDLARPLVDALRVLHDSGYIHRDLKPANVYVRADNSPVLLDFGATRDTMDNETSSSDTMLTPGYAPPEQYESSLDHQGPWTDIYAMGALLYRSITGRIPPDALQRLKTTRSGAPDPLSPLSQLTRLRFAPQFLKAVDRALALNTVERPQSMDQWKIMLWPPGAFSHSGEAIHTDEESAKDQFGPLASQIARDLGLEGDQPQLSAPEKDLLIGFFKQILHLSNIPEHIRQDADCFSPLRPVVFESISHGLKALEYFKERPVDLVVCDSLLADMGGREFLELLGNLPRGRRTPVLVISRDRRQHYILDMTVRGAWAYLVRPCTPDELKRIMPRMRALALFMDIEEELCREGWKQLGADAPHKAMEAFEEVISFEDDVAAGEEAGCQDYQDQGFRELLAERYGAAMAAFSKADRAAELMARSHAGLSQAYKLLNDARRKGQDRVAREALLKAQSLRLMRTKFVDVIKFQSHVPNPWNTLGVKLSKLGELEQAAHAFEQALRDAPQDGVIHFNLAKALLGRNATDKAMAALEKALELEPDLSPAKDLYLQLGRRISRERAGRLSQGETTALGSVLDD